MLKSLAVLLCVFVLQSNIYAIDCTDNNENKSDTIAFVDRLGIHTNLIGWGLLTPNIALEYDLVQNEHRKISLFFSGRYNWNSSEKSPSRYVYNNLGLRGEARWYFRSRKRLDWEKEMVANAEGIFSRTLMSTRFIRARKNPQLHRAYYIGPYVAYDDFALNLSSTGKQGYMLGVGVTLGYTAPLYLYNNGNSIDFEIGASVGVHYADYEKFGYNRVDNCYTLEGKKSGIVPYPMLSDARLSLVYRFNPIKNQILSINKPALDEEERLFKLNRAYNEANAQYVTSDTVLLLNRGIKEENHRIAKINKQILKHEAADSSMLLDELLPLYEFVHLPKNMLLKKKDFLLPNRNIVRVSELNSDFLDDLVEKYSNLVADKGVESVESRIVQNYHSLRSVYVNEDDTTTGISFFELLVKAIPDINSFCIMPHNRLCELMPVDVVESDSAVSRTYLLGVNKSGNTRNMQMRFVEYTDVFYLNNELSTKPILTVNERIKASNIIKIINAERLLGITIEDKSHRRHKQK
ncbi:MAG: DUF3575 domain-containing protein [Bacteroidaceae bacterium]|nr:DUF3575 domain-containing protein [Bacteroidaceae bacterium]